MSSGPQLVLRSVAEIAAGKFRFFIPGYQRGYRWEESQVEELIKDLLEFYELGKKPLYCLQPLVVVPKGAEWEVVDGQQRLTTLFLILSQLPGDGPGFEIRYERHPRALGEILEDIKMGRNPKELDDKPDLHYINEARGKIERLLNPEGLRMLQGLKELSAHPVSFIWYELPGENPIAAFTRLNAGKIPLTDVELIRALFLIKGGELEGPERLRIATAWDRMEKRLNEDEFWGFAAPVGFAPVNRIELVFDVVAGVRLDQKDHQLYNHVEATILRLGPRAAWEEMEKAYSALEEWYEDHAFFHLIGYLSNAGDTAVWDLYSTYWLSGKIATKDRFKQALKGIIKKGMIGDKTPTHFVGELIYGAENMRQALLCFNLAALLTEQEGTVRFSFHAFKTQRWDVEHIHATATEDPVGADLDGFLEMYRSYFKRHPTQDATGLFERLNRALDSTSKAGADPATKKDLYQECRHDEESQEVDHDALNALGNLTLLDSKTNRGYKNASYKVKRAWILDAGRQNIYVPPCTRSVFTKSYTTEAEELLRWNLQAGADGDSYAAAMAALLEEFFQGAEWISSSPLSVVPASGRRGQIPNSSDCSIQASLESLMGETLSFCELMAAYGQIEIPLIQRDYAQGRESESTVRVGFLEAIFKTLRTDDEFLNLDFVYGTGVRSGIFHPIDGQQRLTTLFLLHWIAYWKAGQAKTFEENMSRDGVPRFHYRVRPGAERFFPALLKWEPTSELESEDWFRKELPKQIWFSRNWLHDPTVQGALVMLDEIKMKIEGFSEAQLGHLIARLESIRMEVLVLPGTMPADDVYLKMNARGKPLTDFEKFKAWLVGQHPSPSPDYDWRLRLDQEWLELFWEKSGSKQHPAGTVSACFFNTLLALAINYQAGRSPGGSEEKFADGINEWIKLGQGYRVDHWEKLFDPEAIQAALTSLDGFQKRAGEILELLQSGGWLSKGKHVISDPDLTPSYPDRCWLHAVNLFCLGKCGDDREWFRVARNLIANTDLSAITEFTQTIRSLNALAARMTQGVLAGLATLGDDEVESSKPKSFRDQIWEERIKARLLNAPGNAWEGIREAEEHGFLRGDIGVLLGISTNGEVTAEARAFAERWTAFDLLMDRGKMNPSILGSVDDDRLDRLVLRAVLARCEPISDSEVWLPWMGEGGWGDALKRHADAKPFQSGLIEVIDELVRPSCHRGSDPMVQGLNQIASSPRDFKEPWMRHLIEHGADALNLSIEWKLRHYGSWWTQGESATFLFYQTNASRTEDILIGDEFEVRNELLDHLTTTGWQLSKASEIMSNGRKIFIGHHPELRKGERRMTFFYQSIELDDAGLKQRILFMNQDNPRIIQNVLEELAQSGMPV